jgi:Protein of unknown function (DUF3047)
MRDFWQLVGGLMLLVILGLGLAHGLPDIMMLHFSDLSSQPDLPSQLTFSSPEPEAPAVPAHAWLRRHGWEQVWPKLLFGKSLELTFNGPPAQRYLRLSADNAYAIWSHRLNVDPHQQPILEITWAMERFPDGAALDLHGHNDRPIAVLVSLGPEVHSGGLQPNVPRGLAFFWGETETFGSNYTCITPRNAPEQGRLQCTYPHVKYIALRSGGAGTIHTDRVNLPELFQQQFPDYWQEQHQVPPVVAVSFEAGSDETKSLSAARLYALTFRAANE